MVTDKGAIIQAIAEATVEGAKAAVQAMAVAEGEGSPGSSSELTSAGCMIGKPTLRWYTS